MTENTNRHEMMLQKW